MFIKKIYCDKNFLKASILFSLKMTHIICIKENDVQQIKNFHKREIKKDDFKSNSGSS
jgi:hypothetical protein